MSAAVTTAAGVRRSPWAVTSRTIVFGAIGAALYGALGIFSFIIPGTGNVAIRPAIALIPFVGVRFGPIAGFFTGAIGNAIVDQIQGAGFLTYWNWSLANGLTGLVAGLIAHYLKEPKKTGAQLTRVAGISLVAVVIGMLFTASDILLGNTAEYWFFAEYLPALLTTVVASVIIAPALDQAWKPLQNLSGR
ncbi:ECF transporter S component [Plantibacter sp. Mn2098]|uniref:ECF transporter S component n=1 Tax=Plantibacter sp. Mn2098 TaxID=3395266 RepID=UPI003BE30C8D